MFLYFIFSRSKFCSIAIEVINWNYFYFVLRFQSGNVTLFSFILSQVKIYLLCRLFRLKLLIEFLNFIYFHFLRPENFHYLEIILFILFYFSLFSILFSSFLRIFNNIKNHSLKFYSAFLRSKILISILIFLFLL